MWRSLEAHPPKFKMTSHITKTWIIAGVLRKLLLASKMLNLKTHTRQACEASDFRCSNHSLIHLMLIHLQPCFAVRPSKSEVCTSYSFGRASCIIPSSIAISQHKKCTQKVLCEQSSSPVHNSPVQCSSPVNSYTLMATYYTRNPGLPTFSS